MMQRKRVTVLDSGFSLLVNSFTQSLGAELLTNGAFTAWTGDNPDGWTITGEVTTDPEVSEVGSNEGHGGGGTGAANFFSSATAVQPRASQTVLTIGHIYEVMIDVSTVTSGSVASQDNNTGLNLTLTAAQMYNQMGRAAGTTYRILGNGLPADVTVNSVSVKRIIPNAYLDTIANGSFRQRFTLPASPVSGDQIHLLYRMTASGQEFLNGWDCYLRRNTANTQWDILLDSISNGTRSNRRTVTNVGNVTGIRVDASGTTHQLYTFASNMWTAQGAAVNVSFQDTAVGVNTIASSTFTQSLLEVMAA